MAGLYPKILILTLAACVYLNNTVIYIFYSLLLCYRSVYKHYTCEPSFIDILSALGVLHNELRLNEGPKSNATLREILFMQLTVAFNFKDVFNRKVAIERNSFI